MTYEAFIPSSTCNYRHQGAITFQLMCATGLSCLCCPILTPHFHSLFTLYHSSLFRSLLTLPCRSGMWVILGATMGMGLLFLALP
jgi:hypothetical protein